jgi:hypothetical protein
MLDLILMGICMFFTLGSLYIDDKPEKAIVFALMSIAFAIASLHERKTK